MRVIDTRAFAAAGENVAADATGESSTTWLLVFAIVAAGVALYIAQERRRNDSAGTTAT